MVIEYSDDDVELVNEDKVQDPPCHYCDLALDDGCTFAGDMQLPGRYYCMECLEEYMDDIKGAHSCGAVD